jgi:hypothetical protein
MQSRVRVVEHRAHVRAWRVSGGGGFAASLAHRHGQEKAHPVGRAPPTLV